MKVAEKTSIKSLRSRSRKSILTDRGVSIRYDREYENVKEFEECFPEICRKYGLLRPVYVKREYLHDEFFKNLHQATAGKRKQKEVSRPPSAASKTTNLLLVDDRETAATGSTERIFDDDTLTISAIYDNSDRFVELLFYKLNDTPRELIQIIGFIARYYYHLKRIKIQFCKINAYTVYELSKLICLSSLNEVDLDGSVVPTGNYGILFDNARLNNISLGKCCINDAVCEVIASKICFQGPAESNLYSLNLSSNRITDAGAKCLSNALRSNRTLRYLNLADNHITDKGAGSILDTLKEFQLSRDENLKKSQRYMAYEKQRLAIYFKYLTQYTTRIPDDGKMKPNEGRKSMAVRKSSKPSQTKQKDKHSPRTFTFEDYKNRAEVLAGEMMGPFRDPFQFNHVNIRDGKCYSNGNMTLCYLNLAFNNLAYPSVVKLLDVLQYQRDSKRLGQTGLMRVILKGNNLPMSCGVLIKIDELLNKCMMAYGGKAFSEFSAKRKSRLSRASMIPEKVLLGAK